MHRRGQAFRGGPAGPWAFTEIVDQVGLPAAVLNLISGDGPVDRYLNSGKSCAALSRLLVPAAATATSAPSWVRDRAE